ncbi:hypothetical protein KFL_001090040 [Klebsormidium nitens]|uniref:Pyrroline-5-carboxylate reductase catalytic N-terminal domain-containing protein n=1 Tax=Klebsormidium nitens TaxID=105231 RepID=A0A1Y1HUP7_KLENI|nr:hypothetical protein KFL_001090040 [Klebsormidium nitens]|eukprot:GAQ82355.1 hypothetical protein KFL_001090040 [Klebsormidium nitens]
MAPLNIVVLGGSGNVGSKLAHRLAVAGHNLILTSRNPTDDKAKAAVEFVASEGASGTVKSASFEEAKAAKIDVLIVATPGMTSPTEWSPVLTPLGELEGVVVIDASNPLTSWPNLDIAVNQNHASASDHIQSVLRKAIVYKAFNTLGAEILGDPKIGGLSKTDMLFAGPAEPESAKATVTKVISDVGFRPVYVGPLRYARNLESLAELWIHLAVKFGAGGTWSWAIEGPYDLK